MKSLGMVITIWSVFFFMSVATFLVTNFDRPLAMTYFSWYIWGTITCESIKRCVTIQTYIIRIKLTLSNFVRIVNGGISRFKSMLSIVRGSVGFRSKLGIPVLMNGLRSSIASLRQSFTLSFRTASLQFHKDPIVICWGKYMNIIKVFEYFETYPENVIVAWLYLERFSLTQFSNFCANASLSSAVTEIGDV